MKLPQLSKTALARIARYIDDLIWKGEAQEVPFDPSVSLDEIIAMFQEEPRRAIRGPDMPIEIPVEELWPYREYNWDRENAREGIGTYDPETGEFGPELPGPEKWDALMESMSEGWLEGFWLTLYVGADGQANVGEGNHRLAIARELGYDTVPVFITYRETVPFSSEAYGDYVPENKHIQSRCAAGRPCKNFDYNEDYCDISRDASFDYKLDGKRGTIRGDYKQPDYCPFDDGILGENDSCEGYD